MAALDARPHRQVIDVPGVTHGAMPIPMAVRVGNMIFSSAIHGFDPEAGAMAEDPARQIELVFQHMRQMVESEGGSTEDIAQVVIYLKHAAEHRDLVNAAWVEMFPDERSRPARNTQSYDLSYGMIIHVMMTAVLRD